MYGNLSLLKEMSSTVYLVHWTGHKGIFQWWFHDS